MIELRPPATQGDGELPENADNQERKVDITTLGNDFLNHFYPGDWAREELESPIFAIRADKVDNLAANLLTFIAEVIAQILSAGSEREAVLENFDLYDDIRSELQGWTTEGKP